MHSFFYATVVAVAHLAGQTQAISLDDAAP